MARAAPLPGRDAVGGPEPADEVGRLAVADARREAGFAAVAETGRGTTAFGPHAFHRATR